MNKVFAFTTCNLDIPSEGYTQHQFFNKESDAYKACLNYIGDHSGKNALEDPNGTFTRSEGTVGVDLTYKLCKGKPAIYYKTRFGSYNCVAFIDTIPVH